MRKLVALFASALVGWPGLATAQGGLGGLGGNGPGFDIRECTANATDILVTDANGRVVEVWKGTAAPGEWVPVDRFFRPRLPYLALSPSADARSELDFICRNDWPGTAAVSEGLILFLVRVPRTDPATEFLGGWLPAARHGWFESSVGRVNRIWLVYVQPPWCCMLGEPCPRV